MKFLGNYLKNHPSMELAATVTSFNYLQVAKGFISYYLLALLFMLSSEAVYYDVINNPEETVTYEAVEAVKELFIIREEDLFFSSTSEVFKQSDLAWEDTLICNIIGDDKKGGYFSQYKSKSTDAAVKRHLGDGVWRYGSAIPIQDADCTLFSQTFVVNKIFFVLEIKKPITPVKSKGTFKFRKQDSKQS